MAKRILIKWPGEWWEVSKHGIEGKRRAKLGARTRHGMSRKVELSQVPRVEQDALSRLRELAMWSPESTTIAASDHHLAM